MEKTRGFVTIATGDKRYYEMARNLLYSYRQFASINCPFAIICDKENDYTKEFDDVIILDKVYKSYLDKLQLYRYLPYDETIFIDADSLAYGDLDEWWEIFKNADDFSLFGYAYTDLKCGRGWFFPEGLKEYKNQVSFIPDFNGGIYYLRRSERCKRVFERANYFAEHYFEYAFRGIDNIVDESNDVLERALKEGKTFGVCDEQVLALAMAIENCQPIDVHEKGLAFAPTKKNIRADISIPEAYYKRTKNDSYFVYLIHWSNYKTRLAFYKSEVKKLLLLKEKRKLPLGGGRGYYYLMRPFDLFVFIARVNRKIMKIIRKA